MNEPIPPVCLVVIKSTGSSRSRETPYRVVQARAWVSDPELALERMDTDALGKPSWVPVPFSEIEVTFHDNLAWKAVWKKAATDLGQCRGEILDTRTAEYLPEAYRGVVHGYSTENNHAPDDEEQDAYAVRKKRGLAFTSTVPVLEKVKGVEAERVLLGAFVVLARARNDP